jgi:hypothetical protein
MAQDERRGSPRTTVHPDDSVTINNLRFALRNWSRTGLLFGPLADPPEVGLKVEAKVSVIAAGERIRFDAQTEVLRVANGLVAVRYQCASTDVLPLIDKHFQGSP